MSKMPSNADLRLLFHMVKHSIAAVHHELLEWQEAESSETGEGGDSNLCGLLRRDEEREHLRREVAWEQLVSADPSANHTKHCAGHLANEGTVAKSTEFELTRRARFIGLVIKIVECKLRKRADP